MFNSEQEKQTKAILITGCDTGFGNAIAIKLNKLGFRVIASCLKQESVDAFLSNSIYTQHGSTSITLDVTKQQNIDFVKSEIEKYLNETKSELWAIVNNAGFYIHAPFEVVPKEFDTLQRSVLYTAPLNIMRAFIPLLPGRKHWKTVISNDKAIRTANNGGRIVNISSCAAKFVADTRYGPSKTALSYVTHALRVELSPRFGIWCSAIHPGGYATGIGGASLIWMEKVAAKQRENGNSEILDIYDYDVSKMEVEMKGAIDKHARNIDPVVDSVIHGLTAKYPKREYNIGWEWYVYVFMNIPWAAIETMRAVMID